MFRKLSLILLAVIVSSGNLLAADWAPAVTSSATYKLTSSGSGNKFYVNGGTTAYDGIATFNLNSGKTINIEFNTSKPVNVNGIIKVTNGILNLSIGNDYSGVHSTLKRGTRAGDLICVQNSTATQSSCKLTITGNEANEFMIHGNSTFAVTGTDATGYSVTADEDQKHRGVLVDFYGGVLTMEYVKLCNNYNNSTNNNLKFGSAIRHYEKENAPYSTGEITLTNCTIQDCYSENAGTALVLRNEHSTKKTTVTMTGCTIMRCFCEAIGSSNGGIIRTWAASFCTLKMEKCAIKNNKSKSNSCIAWNAVQTDPIQLIDDTISGNWTSGRGCGIWISGLGTIEGCVISGNYCKNYGGGLCYTVYTATNPITDFSPNNGTLTLDANTTISGNTAEGNGGGVYFQVNPLNIGNTTYYKNSEGEQYECSLVIDGATISGNKSLKDGGGIYLSRTTDIYKSNLEVKASTL